MTSNFVLKAKPGIKIRSIAAFDTILVPDGGATPGTANQHHFREFYYSGSSEIFVVPDGFFGVLDWMLWGSAGQGNHPTFAPGNGGHGLKLNVNHAPSVGTSVLVTVGGKPFNGGGNVSSGGCKGGGATDLRVGGTALSNRIAAASGGGGAGTNPTSMGDAGYPNGQGGNSPSAYVATGGGTQTAGGQGGSGTFFVGGGGNGTLGQGGDGGGNTFLALNGGGGGGGLYGGGGGNGNSGGLASGSGGGGSGLVSGAVTLLSYATSDRDRALPGGFATVDFHVSRSTDRPDDVTDTFSYRKFFYTGDVQGFVVPDGVYWIWVRMLGGNGASGAKTGGSGVGGPGGMGDLLEGWLSVVPGQPLQLTIGGNANGPTWIPSPPHFEPAPAAYNGGGASGTPGFNSFSSMGGGGAGATDIRIGTYTLAERVLVAGGGGGGGGSAAEGAGGNAGYPNGQNGQGYSVGGAGGTGGTQTSGNALGVGGSVSPGGGFGDAAAGGGGGYWGGTTGSGAGGGSSYHDSDATEDVTHTTRLTSDVPYIEIRW
jgi:hypothetical protein